LSIYERCEAIAVSADSLREGFRHEFAKVEKHASCLFSRDMKTTALVDAMEQLASTILQSLYKNSVWR
jgi:hypothetical protein